MIFPPNMFARLQVNLRLIVSTPKMYLLLLLTLSLSSLLLWSCTPVATPSNGASNVGAINVGLTSLATPNLATPNLATTNLATPNLATPNNMGGTTNNGRGSVGFYDIGGNDSAPLPLTALLDNTPPVNSGNNSDSMRDLAQSEQLYFAYLNNGTIPVSLHLPQVDAATFISDPESPPSDPTMFPSNYSYPINIDPLAKKYISYYTGPARRTFQMWLERSNRYIDVVKDILYEEGVPVDFMALPFAESGYNTEAVSWVGATGIWQFMPKTGLYYGLKQDFWQDDRKDFEASTRAAAKYLKKSYKQFGDWHLSTASYNAGPGKISRAISYSRSRDFYVLNQGTYLAKETSHYVPKYTALLIIYKNYLDYGFTMPKTEPMIYKTINIPSQANFYVIADTLGISVGEIREFNPGLLHPVTPPNSYNLRIPVSVSQKNINKLLGMSREELLQYTVYYANKGQSVKSIADRYGVSIAELKRINALSSSYLTSTRPVLVPLKGYYDRSLNKWFQLNVKPGNDLYLVRRGDSLESIARKVSMSVEELIYLNGERSYGEIIPGQRLVIGAR